MKVEMFLNKKGEDRNGKNYIGRRLQKSLPITPKGFKGYCDICKPASSYGLHGADPGSAPFSPVTPPRVTLYAKLYLQQWHRGREEYQIRGRTEARRPTTLPAGRSRLR